MLKSWTLFFLEIVINDITARISNFQTLISTSSQALKVIDANLDKVIYSRLVALLVPVLINKASKSKYCFQLNLIGASTHNQAKIKSNLIKFLDGLIN
jgi:hypothetical protein